MYEYGHEAGVLWSWQLCKTISYLQGLLGSNYRGSLPVSFNYDALSTISFTTIISLVDRDETRPKQVFSPLTLKKLGIVTELTCFFFARVSTDLDF